MNVLGELTPREFLKRHWQKAALRVRQAFAGFEWPLTAEELAGLACEEGIESRIVIERGGDRVWEVRHGPFGESDFAGLPDERWTLLVQRVDRLLPAASRLVEPFRFLPNWRFDDVMVSYGAPRGSVGPHVDNYDVFLVQGPGRRHWRIGERPLGRGDECWIPDCDLQVLAQFEPDEEWVLETGDMLYLPPRLPHHGIAVEGCLTFSIGFRAPAESELIGGLLSEALTAADSGALYADPDLRPESDPGRLDPTVLAWAKDVLRRSLGDGAMVERSFARFLSAPEAADLPLPPDAQIAARELRRYLADGWRLDRRAVRDWVFIDRADGQSELYVGGEEFLVSSAVARLLSGARPLDASSLNDLLQDDATTALLCHLTNAGWLLLEREGRE